MLVLVVVVQGFLTTAVWTAIVLYLCMFVVFLADMMRVLRGCQSR